MKFWPLFTAFSLVALTLHGQSTRLSKADDYFYEGKLQAAIPLYHQVLQRQDVPYAKVNLAEAYYGIGDYHTAANWFALVMPMEECQPVHQLKYGYALLHSGKCETAVRWFKLYLEQRPFDPRKPDLLDACNKRQMLENKSKGQIEVASLPFNAPSNDFSPVRYQDGLVFTSDRYQLEGQQLAHLYKVTVTDEDSLGFSTPKAFDVGTPENLHEGPATFNTSGNEIFYTRTRPGSQARKKLEIRTGRLLPQGTWSALYPLPFCSDEYAVAFPALSPDGNRLFFASDMPGGYGGVDLYASVRINGDWGQPINLGPVINTPGDELYPYVGLNNDLYFSSNGLLGLGMQDIFVTREGADGTWQRPENLGAPFNSAADDFGYTQLDNSEKGFFTSNRQGGAGGDDIYFFQRSGRLAAVDVLDLTNGMPVPNAALLNTHSGDTLQTDDSGRIFLRVPSCTTFTGWQEGFFPKSVDICPDDIPGQSDTLFLAIALQPDIPQILKGVVFDRTSGRPLQGAKIQLQPEGDCTATSTVYANAQGRFTVELQNECCYTITSTLEHFESVTPQHSVCATGLNREQYLNLFLQPVSKAMPVSAPVDTAVSASPPAEAEPDLFEGFERSRPSAKDTSSAQTFKLNVYYDTGRSSVQPSSVSELLKLRDLLLKNPNLVVEISSHTDANGNAVGNEELSQRRANAIVRYLTSEGIDRGRMIPVGYGEALLTNECADDVDCPDWKHQENRRTEFRVLRQ
ncbi:MAG: OmpA family protein [Phaeodactylibacter sp.]|uniref:OmpA family protein n=1 Tax=Phaeodactylibacter sp. TaxID=1940289 RepID=UPI0032EE8BA4